MISLGDAHAITDGIYLCDVLPFEGSDYSHSHLTYHSYNTHHKHKIYNDTIHTAKYETNHVVPSGSRISDTLIRYDKLLYSSKPSKSSITKSSILSKISPEFEQIKKIDQYRIKYKTIIDRNINDTFNTEHKCEHKNIDTSIDNKSHIKLDIIPTDTYTHVVFRFDVSHDVIANGNFLNHKSQYDRVIQDIGTDTVKYIRKYKKYEDYYVLCDGKNMSEISVDETIKYTPADAKPCSTETKTDYTVSCKNYDNIYDITWYILKHGNLLSDVCMNIVLKAYSMMYVDDLSKHINTTVIKNTQSIIHQNIHQTIQPDTHQNIQQDTHKDIQLNTSNTYITYFTDTDCDISKWCAESIILGNSENFNERSKLSEMTSMYILNKYFGARSVKNECDVKYYNEFWKKCDYITNIDGHNLAISVARMNGPIYFYIPTDIRYCLGALELLYKKMYGLVVARIGILDDVSYDNSILHIFVSNERSARAIVSVFNCMNDDVKSDISLVITVIDVSNKLFVSKFFY